MQYYHYKDGKLIGASEVDPTVGYNYRQPGTPREQPVGDVVGAYLAARSMFYPAFEAPRSNQQAPLSHISQQQDSAVPGAPSSSSSYPSNTSYESHNRSGPIIPDHSNTRGYVGDASLSGLKYPYPDPDRIRHLHTLHSILPYIQPERKLHSLDGPVMDIVEQDTGNVFAYAIPKKVLVLFLGRRILNKFIKTLEREDTSTWSGGPTKQILCLPRGHSSKAAIQILLAWMIRACQRHTMGIMRQITIPANTFAACSLAQTMELLGLHKDALRVDTFIAHNHFTRPVYASELESLWNCLGERSRYVYAAVRAVGARLQAYEHGEKGVFADADNIMDLLRRESRLGKRVWDPQLNEKFRPEFGMKWMQYLHLDTRYNGQGGAGPSRTAGHGGEETGADGGDVRTEPQELVKGRRVGVLRIVAREGSAAVEERGGGSGGGEEAGMEGAKL
ncbi:hypothetical protein IQ07DRAFT_595012 [Pyrenochaeta sp. DS3sAY3a]|nr:hypothetical protein IQ07DRAFT_595012 [Pyrenochaeta sp. DS3sAY3a]